MMLFPRVLIFLVMVSVACKSHARATATTGSTCSYTFENGACRGHDIWSGKLSYSQCEYKCTNRADCKSFQYHGTCWLKNFVCSKSQLTNVGQTGSSQYTKHCRDDKDSGCGSPMYQTGNSGAFNSMNFPGKYAHNANCTWIIKVPSRHRIRLYFYGIFDLEKHSTCKWDSVSLYENTSSTRLIGKYCQIRPNQLVSQDNDFRVVFKSDSSGHGSGFRLYWWAVKPTASGCGSRYIQSGKSGSISSRNYPNNYQNNADCAWHIRVQYGMRVRLEFERKFEIEKGDDGSCGFDSVAVRGVEASGNFGQSYGVFCGVSAPKTLIISDDSDIAVFFKSDSSTAHAGFRLKWDAIKFACGIPNSPTNGQVTLSDHDNVNSKATYSCNTGFELVGSNRRCEASGRWTGNPPICQRKAV